jgi:hypothetical protein
MEPQRVPRYVVRQAPGSSLFNVVDTASGKAVTEHPRDRHGAMELAASLERGLAATTAQVAAALARVEAATGPAPDRRTKAAARTAAWRERKRAEAAAQGGAAA